MKTMQKPTTRPSYPLWPLGNDCYTDDPDNYVHRVLCKEEINYIDIVNRTAPLNWEDIGNQVDAAAIEMQSTAIMECFDYDKKIGFQWESWPHNMTYDDAREAKMLFKKEVVLYNEELQDIMRLRGKE